MFFRSIAKWLPAVLIVTAWLRGGEHNAWPVVVRQTDAEGRTEQAHYAGPLISFRDEPIGIKVFRPLYLQIRTGDQKKTDALFYPFFTWRSEPDFHSFSFFELINFTRSEHPEMGTTRAFDIWPFYFSRSTDDPTTSYRALFPIGGTIKHRFGKDRIRFVLFPFYAQVEKSGRRTTHAPWPFLRFTGGTGYYGFEFWPLFGHSGHVDDYDNRFYLWPLIYKSANHLSNPEPDVKVGFLPFYTRDTGPGYISENYAWPFFGYTHRTAPDHFDERRYFWPFLVQARGNQRYVNRWAPFFTHSIVKGYDKTWAPWPVYRRARWEDDDIAQERTQLLYFLYWSQTQHSLTNPAAAPARKTHLWPLYSFWDNGAGRRQVQVFSPFEVFLPNNEPVRLLYTPLAAIYRYDRQDADHSRHSLLWNAVTYRRGTNSREFHLGPILGLRSNFEISRIDVGNGLLSWRREPGERWRFSFFDFRSKTVNNAAVPPSS